MSWTRKAALAAAVLNCANLAAAAPANSPTGQWLKDGSCALFSADAHPGDTVAWTGACRGGKASGLGTATFTGTDGKAQSFTADFVEGVVPDGYVATRWGQGWSYEGEAKGGVFNGAGILTTDANDRFEGQWLDGKMTGFGVLRRSNGERYAGDWKNDKPNGSGELRHADGTLVTGMFVDGRLNQASMASTPKTDAPVLTQAVAQALVQPVEKPAPAAAKQADAPFSTVSGKTLTGVDGSTIALNPIEGGMEMQLTPSGSDGGSNARKTTFTYMTDRMGTVVEDSSAPAAGTSVTGFFRLTAKGIEVRYADGRSAMLSANNDGGVQMALEGDAGKSCQAWYPTGHNFSDAEKRAALNAYAGKLGLAVAAANTGKDCTTPLAKLEPQASPNMAQPATPAPGNSKLKVKTAHTVAKAPPHLSAPASASLSKTAYHVGDYAQSLQTVAVKSSEIHAIDGDAPIRVPTTRETVAAPAAYAAIQIMAPVKSMGDSDASKCLTVDSDGSHWGFRNACGFAVQFAYCMAGSADQNSLAACSAAEKTSITGSVAANGFGALGADASLKEKDTAHNFRWIACNGGAGEVVAHLDHFEPPVGRCERTRTASN